MLSKNTRHSTCWLYVILFTSQISSASAQTPFRHSIYGELGQFLVSVNYEYSLEMSSDTMKSAQGLWLVRTGIGGFYLFLENFGIPLMISFHYGTCHRLELSAGIAFHSYKKKEHSGFSYGKLSEVLIKEIFEIGYRYQKPDGGFIFKLCVSVMTDHQAAFIVPGIGFGGSW